MNRDYQLPWQLLMFSAFASAAMIGVFHFVWRIQDESAVLGITIVLITLAVGFPSFLKVERMMIQMWLFGRLSNQSGGEAPSGGKARATGIVLLASGVAAFALLALNRILTHRSDSLANMYVGIAVALCVMLILRVKRPRPKIEAKENRPPDDTGPESVGNRSVALPSLLSFLCSLSLVAGLYAALIGRWFLGIGLCLTCGLTFYMFRISTQRIFEKTLHVGLTKSS